MKKKKRNKEKKFMAAILRAVYIHYTLTTVHSKKEGLERNDKCDVVVGKTHNQEVFKNQ